MPEGPLVWEHSFPTLQHFGMRMESPWEGAEDCVKPRCKAASLLHFHRWESRLERAPCSQSCIFIIVGKHSYNKPPSKRKWQAACSWALWLKPQTGDMGEIKPWTPSLVDCLMIEQKLHLKRRFSVCCTRSPRCFQLDKQKSGWECTAPSSALPCVWGLASGSEIPM